MDLFLCLGPFGAEDPKISVLKPHKCQKYLFFHLRLNVKNRILEKKKVDDLSFGIISVKNF